MEQRAATIRQNGETEEDPVMAEAQVKSETDLPKFPDWMSKLPPRLTRVPLRNLAIPGKEVLQQSEGQSEETVSDNMSQDEPGGRPPDHLCCSHQYPSRFHGSRQKH